MSSVHGIRLSTATALGVFALVLLLVIGAVYSDDQLHCCSRGVKSMQGVAVCDDQCCPGLSEKVQEVPGLGVAVWCDTAGKEETAMRMLNSMFRRRR